MNVPHAPAPDSISLPFPNAWTVPVVLRRSRAKKQLGMAVGVIRAADLTSAFTIPRRDFSRKTGYQREISISRVNRLITDLQKKRVDLPTAVLLNLRDFDEAHDLKHSNGVDWFSPNGKPLFVVDGQHRIEALKRLVADSPADWSDFQIAFVCMLGASETEEMEQFYVVNSTAKSVRTDLAFDLLKQRAESDPSVMSALHESGETWKVEAQALTEELSKTPIWLGRIRFSGQDKGQTTIGSSGMAGSLQEVLANSYFSRIQSGQRLQIIDSYWRGIRAILPEAFDDPPEYALQKSMGVQVMHRVLLAVLECLRSEGRSLLEADSYSSALRSALLRIEGENAQGETVRGAAFWRSGPEGAAGGFSSNAGRRVLTGRLRVGLPVPRVD